MNFRIMVLAGFSGAIAMATPAVASPLRLTDSQLDGITAGAAATTVSGTSGTALGTAGVYEFATARQYGPLQVAVGTGTAVAVGRSPETSERANGSGDVVFTDTFHSGGQLVSLSSGFGLALSFGK
jgi:hypothetical protein